MKARCLSKCNRVAYYGTVTARHYLINVLRIRFVPTNLQKNVVWCLSAAFEEFERGTFDRRFRMQCKFSSVILVGNHGSHVTAVTVLGNCT